MQDRGKYGYLSVISERQLIMITYRYLLDSTATWVVVEKTYARWRARSGLRLDKAGGRRAPGDSWLKYNFQYSNFFF